MPMVEKIHVLDVAELVSLMDVEKNKLANIDVSRLYVNSSKSISWKCSNGHTFDEEIKIIYRRKNKCFYCTGRQVWTGENDLQSLYPDLAAEFDCTKNNVTPDKISPKDTHIYWWTCKEHHPSFKQSVNHRVERKTICPYCSGRKVITGQTDLQTLFPEIAAEWDIENNIELLPTEVSPYSYTSCYWICPKGHRYKKKIIQRTKFHKPIDCPKCIKAHATSFPEQAIYYYVKKCFPDAINRYKEPFEKGMELDIYVPEYHLGIEYDGEAFHNSEEQHQREYRKYNVCKELGIKLIRIKEAENGWIDTADKVFFVKKRMNDEEITAFLYHFFSSVFAFSKYTFIASENNKDRYMNHYYGFPTEFDISKDRLEILEYLVDVENSFGQKHPKLASMWSVEGNKNITPYMFTSGSNQLVTWECPICGETWKSPIASIVSRNVTSCPTCSMKNNGAKITRAKTIKHGSLAERSKELLEQWDYEANIGLSPYDIPLNYSFKVGWKCNICGYKWYSSPATRVRNNKVAGCPHCTGRVVMPGIDDLETLYPDIAKEWDYEKNKPFQPSQIKPFSNKKYYWICKNCNKSYFTLPGSRIKGHGCPSCAQKIVGQKNSKKVGQYDKNGILLNTYQSLHHAAQSMGVNPNAIFQAVKFGRQSKGYYWRYISD